MNESFEKTYPRYPFAELVDLGIALAEQGNLEAAIASFNTAIRLDPDDPDAHTNLGVALQEQKKLSEAIRAHQQALALNPDSAEFRHNLGNALFGQGKLAQEILVNPA